MSEHTAVVTMAEEIRELARRVALERIAPGALDRDRTRSFPWEGIRALGETGLLEVGRACASTALVYVSTPIAAKAIEVAGSAAMKEKWLPPLMSGGSVGAFAVHEPGSDCNSAAITTRAWKDGDYYRVDGPKFFITFGQEADSIAVHQEVQTMIADMVLATEAA